MASYQPFVSNQKTVFGALRTESAYSIFNQIFIYNINSRLFSTATTGSGITPDVNLSRARVQTSANDASSSLLRSKKYIKYHASIGCEAVFTGVFTAGVVGCNQYIGPFNDLDGFFIGYSGTSPIVGHRYNGVDTLINRTSWNYDRADGTQILPVIDFTLGNVFKIEFQYLGYGAINFYIESPETGLPVLIHRIKYSNTSVNTSLTNPNLPFSIWCENITNNTNMTVFCGSVGLNLQGGRPRTLLPLSVESIEKAITAGLELNVLSLEPQNPYNGVANNESYIPRYLSITTSGFNKPVVIRLRLGATITGISYTTIPSSFMEYSNNGTTVSGGIVLFSKLILGDTSATVDLNEFDLMLNNDSLTVSAFTSSGTGEVSCSLVFSEDL